MDELERDEWAILQVLFCRARQPWADNLRVACEDPYKPRQFLVPGLDQKTLSEKLRAPLYDLGGGQMAACFLAEPNATNKEMDDARKGA